MIRLKTVSECINEAKKIKVSIDTFIDTVSAILKLFKFDEKDVSKNTCIVISSMLSNITNEYDIGFKFKLFSTKVDNIDHVIISHDKNTFYDFTYNQFKESPIPLVVAKDDLSQYYEVDKLFKPYKLGWSDEIGYNRLDEKMHLSKIKSKIIEWLENDLGILSTEEKSLIDAGGIKFTLKKDIVLKDRINGPFSFEKGAPLYKYSAGGERGLARTSKTFWLDVTDELNSGLISDEDLERVE